MKNLQTGTTCLSSSTGSKQHKCERSLLRLATFVILFLCSMTIAWAEGTTTTGEQQFSFTIGNAKSYTNEIITATFTGNDLDLKAKYIKLRSKGDGTLTIDANGATISNISLLANTTTSEPDNGISIESGTTSVKVSDVEMPVEWKNGNKSVVFKSASEGIYVFGATITYMNDNDGKLSLNVVSAPTITPNDDETSTSKLSFIITDRKSTRLNSSHS